MKWRAPWMVIGIVVMAGLISNSVGAAQTGCGALATVAERDSSFTPWEGRFGYAPERPIQRTGALIEADRIDDALPFAPPSILPTMPLRAQFLVDIEDLDGDGKTEPALVRYFSTAAWAKDLTFPEFVVGGGIILRAQLAAGMDAGYIAGAVGSRATLVDIGPHLGALVHADPISPMGERPYYLTWSDGQRDLQLVALVSAADLVNLARTGYCS